MMRDQAEQLRLLVEQEKQYAKTLAVTSGKGGVGKSNFSLNFSILLAKQGKRVLLFDMDMGMGNIDVLMGSIAKHSIVDFFQKEMTLSELITKGPHDFSYISGGTGLTSLFSMNEHHFQQFTSQFLELQKIYDFIIFDFGAGITKESSEFLMCIDEIIMITTTEPSSIMDAYSVIKYVHIRNRDVPIYLVCNRIMKESQCEHTFLRLQTTLKRFLDRDIILLGYLPDSTYVLQAVSRQIPFAVFNSNSDISMALERITLHYLSNTSGVVNNLKNRSFIAKLKFFSMKGSIFCEKNKSSDH